MPSPENKTVNRFHRLSILLAPKFATAFCLFCLSAPEPIQALTKAISFFRAPQSLFPSGQTSPEALNKKIIGNEFLFRYLVEAKSSEMRAADAKPSQKKWVEAKAVARDIDLSEKVFYHEKEYLLKELRGYWALLESGFTGQQEWAPVYELKSSPQDLGMAMTLITTSLRYGPSWSAELITNMPGRSTLKIISVQDSWLKVKYTALGANSTPQMGYVDLNNVLLKADFASEVMDNDGKWQKVSYRESSILHLQNQRSLAINEVKLWKTRDDLAVVTESDESQKLMLRQNLTILKTEAQVWGISQLKDHGKVFWKRPLASELPPAEAQLSKDELLKREVFSVAWSPLNKRVGLASSHGIFATLDGGETWTYLSQFKNDNHPVSISPDGSWFVGFLKSKDLGKTFSNYLPIDYLTKIVLSRTISPPRILKISQINFSNSIMQITVDTGVKQLKLATRSKSDLITDWDLIN